MQSCRPGLMLHRTIFIVIAMLLCSFMVMPLSWNRIYAADSDEALDQLYAKLQSGERVWKEKDYTEPEQPTVYLTFDDGPSKLTPQVLDILREEEVKATFFVLGGAVKSHPELARQIVEEGHSIGNHTYNHVYKELYSSLETFWDQVQTTEQIIKEASGVETRLLRAPGGTFSNFDSFYFYSLDQAGYEIHDWNIDSGDSKRIGVPSSEILETVQKGPFGKQVILLMHDGTGHDQTVKALPDIIHLFKDKGYAFAPLTTDVRPYHFRAGKLSIPRSLSEAQFKELLAQAEQHQRLLAKENGTQPDVNEGTGTANGSGEPAGNVAETPAEPVANSTPLELEVNGVTYELKPDQYCLQQGSYQIPLRVWAQAIGARVEWNEAERTASWYYGSSEVSYDFSRLEQRTRHAGLTTISHLPPMELREGTVWVPLRRSVEQIGGSIVSFGERDGRAHIAAELVQPFPIHGLSGWIENK